MFLITNLGFRACVCVCVCVVLCVCVYVCVCCACWTHMLRDAPPALPSTLHSPPAPTDKNTHKHTHTHMYVCPVTHTHMCVCPVTHTHAHAHAHARAPHTHIVCVCERHTFQHGLGHFMRTLLHLHFQVAQFFPRCPADALTNFFFFIPYCSLGVDLLDFCFC